MTPKQVLSALFIYFCIGLSGQHAAEGFILDSSILHINNYSRPEYLLLPSRSIKHQYNSELKPEIDVYYTYSRDTDIWVQDIKKFYTYNASGSPVEIIYYIEDSTGQERISWLEKISYDESGNLLKHRFWKAFPGQIVNDTTENYFSIQWKIFSYDEAGNVLSYIDSSRVSVKLYEYVYNDAYKITEEVHSGSGGFGHSLIPELKIDFIYENDTLLRSKIEHRYSYPDDEWVPHYKREYHYHPDNRIQFEDFYWFNLVDSLWEIKNSLEHEYKFDENGRLIYYMYFTEKLPIQTVFEEYSYHTNGQIDSMIITKAYANQEITRYDIHGNMILYQRLDLDKNIIKSQWEYIYKNLSSGTNYNERENPIHVYPNPCNDKLYFSGIFSEFKNEKIQIEIFDMQGKKVMSIPSELSPGSGVQLHNLRPGMYILHLEGTHKNYQFKILKR